MTATEQIELLLTGEAVVVVEAPEVAAPEQRFCTRCREREIDSPSPTATWCKRCLAAKRAERKAARLQGAITTPSKPCSECKVAPRRVYKSGHESCYCVKCDKKNSNKSKNNVLLRQLKAEAATPKQPDPLLPKRIVKPVRSAPAPKPHQWHITNVGKRNVFGQPIQEHGTPAVSYLTPAQIAEAKRNRSKVFGAGARV